MNRLYFLLTGWLILVASIGALAQDIEPPRIVHMPVSYGIAGVNIPIVATITDNVGVTSATLFYRVSAAPGISIGYTPVPMVGAANIYTGTIPDMAVTSRGVDYYISATDAAGNTGTAPPANAAAAPYRIIVGVDTIPPTITIMHPGSGAQVDVATPMIGAGLADKESGIDVNTVKMTVDGTDVTSQAEVTQDYVFYTPKEPLSFGRHEVVVEVKDKMGNRARESWYFMVVAVVVPVVPKVKYTGSYTTTLQTASIDNPNWRNFYWYVPVEPTASMEWNANITGIGPDFTLTGMFNRRKEFYTYRYIDRIKMDYYSRNLDLSIGDFWPSFSELSLYGLLIRGLGTTIRAATGTTYNTYLARSKEPQEASAFSTGVYAQYLYGGGIQTNLSKDLRAAVGTFYLYDELGSISNPGPVGPSGYPLAPAISNKITGVASEYKLSETVKLTGEYMRSEYDSEIRDTTPALSDRAYTLKASSQWQNLSFAAGYLNIGRDFYPAGGEQFFENDKKGIDLSLDWRTPPGLYLSTKYLNTKGTTSITNDINRQVIALFLLAPGLPNLNLRYDKYKRQFQNTTSTITVSALGITQPLRIARELGESSLSVNYQKVGYESGAIKLDTIFTMYGFDTAYKNLLTFSLVHYLYSYKNLMAGVTTDNRSTNISVNFNLVPFKLVAIGKLRFDRNKSSDSSVDNRKREVGLEVNYILTEGMQVSLGYKRINYWDRPVLGYDYGENILYTIFARSF